MPTSIRLDPDIESRLDALARETCRTKAFYLRELIRNGLEDMEDIYRADQVIERIRRGEERTYSLEEVSAELGLDD